MRSCTSVVPAMVALAIVAAISGCTSHCICGRATLAHPTMTTAEMTSSVDSRVQQHTEASTTMRVSP